MEALRTSLAKTAGPQSAVTATDLNDLTGILPVLILADGTASGATRKGTALNQDTFIALLKLYRGKNTRASEKVRSSNPSRWSRSQRFGRNWSCPHRQRLVEGEPLSLTGATKTFYGAIGGKAAKLLCGSLLKSIPETSVPAMDLSELHGIGPVLIDNGHMQQKGQAMTQDTFKSLLKLYRGKSTKVDEKVRC